MSATDVDVTGRELVDRARALRPLLQRNAADVDAGRRVVDENVAALEDAGLFRITVPRRFGGFEVPFATKTQVSAALGEACGSTAWVVTLVNVCNWLGALYGEQAQNDVWGSDPNARICGVLTPTAQARRVDGGFQISGSWGYASGCLHAQWAVLGFPVQDGHGEIVDQGLALIPMSDLRVEDTWFVAGMRGTALISAHGSASFAEANPIQRLWRDSATAGRHAVIMPSVNTEVYGKALLGIPYEANITPLI